MNVVQSHNLCYYDPSFFQIILNKCQKWIVKCNQTLAQTMHFYGSCFCLEALLQFPLSSYTVLEAHLNYDLYFCCLKFLNSLLYSVPSECVWYWIRKDLNPTPNFLINCNKMCFILYNHMSALSLPAPYCWM